MHNWKNLLKLLASVTAVQLIGFALLPLFGRLYTRADYGILGMLMSVVGLITPLASMRYDQAALVAKQGPRLRLLRALGLSICIGITLLLVLLALLAPAYLSKTSYAPAVPYLMIIPLTVFSSGLYSILAAQSNVRADYGAISLASLAQGYLNNGLKVVCGWAAMGVWGFAVAFNSGTLLGVGILSLRQRGESWLRGLSLYRLRVVAQHYSSFPKYTSLMVTVAMLITNILAMLLPNFYAVEEVGIITMLYMITRRPVQVYSEATGRVYARRLVEAEAEGRDFRPDMRRVFLRLLIGAVLGAVLAPYIAEHLVVLVLGEQWALLGRLIPWLIPFLLMESMCYIFHFIPDVLRRQRSYMLVQLLRLGLELGFIFVLAPRMDFFLFIRSYFLFAATEYALINLWFYRLLSQQSSLSVARSTAH